ncbi:glycosyltransferase family 2 protein, partial [Patescibacteria group bacterium]|nr:glycosyltransferase family 2 protein [Patescibacteria group bacterium]
MKVVIVIPTYNELENIKKLVPAVFESCLKIPSHECHVLVVDGNSPDGTGDAVQEMALENDRIHLLREKEKSGLGGAYILAFKHAMQELGAEVVMEMDADFQHNPKDIPAFIKKIEEGYDYVIGSRFVQGGSIPKEWGAVRKFWSVGGNIFSKIVLGIRDVSDFTSGFKASRVRNYLDRLDLDSVRSKGFAYKIDLLYKMHKQDAKIAEVPIAFGLRDRGNSKMESNNALDSLKVVLAIRLEENKNLVRFCLVGICGLLTDTVLFNLFRITIFDPALATIVSGLIAMLVTFVLNNIWSFGERKICGLSRLIGTFAIYSVSSLIPIIIRSQLVELFVKALGNTFLVANAGF